VSSAVLFARRPSHRRSARRSVRTAVSCALLLLLVACGGDGGEGPGRPRVTIGAFNFSESAILAHLYAGALEAAGYEAVVRENLGNRELVAPALTRGDIDLYPGYAATELEFFNSGAGEASADPAATVERLRSRLATRNLTAFTPSPAVDTNAFVMTRATADRLRVSKLSELGRVSNELVLGGPPECPARPFCIPGLESRYGIEFESFRPLDPGGPLTKTALANGDIDVALIFSSDGFIAANGLVVLADDRGLQNADNVVPVVRTSVVTDTLREALDGVSAALTTETLTQLNAKADVDKKDPDDIAREWLDQNGY